MLAVVVGGLVCIHRLGQLVVRAVEPEVSMVMMPPKMVQILWAEAEAEDDVMIRILEKAGPVLLLLH